MNSQLMSDLLQVKDTLDKLMKLKNSNYKLAVTYNELGETIYLDSASLYLDRAIETANNL